MILLLCTGYPRINQIYLFSEINGQVSGDCDSAGTGPVDGTWELLC